MAELNFWSIIDDTMEPDESLSYEDTSDEYYEPRHEEVAAWERQTSFVGRKSAEARTGGKGQSALGTATEGVRNLKVSDGPVPDAASNGASSHEAAISSDVSSDEEDEVESEVAVEDAPPAKD